MLKRNLAVLLAGTGAASVNINAMESKKNITMKDYVKNRKVISMDVLQAKDANWFASPQSLKTRSEMYNLSNRIIRIKKSKNN